MLKPTVYCYCDFSVSRGVVPDQVEDLLRGISNHFGFQEKFVRHIPCEDEGWTGNIFRVIEKLSDKDYVFFWFDDLLVRPNELIDSVSNALEYLSDYPYVRVTGRPIGYR